MNNSNLNPFDVMKAYKVSSVWSVDESKTRYFTEENTANVISAYVVEGDYGNSVKIKRKLDNGEYEIDFQPLSRESNFILGDKVDLLKCKLICLVKKDAEDIYRLEEL